MYCMALTHLLVSCRSHLSWEAPQAGSRRGHTSEIVPCSLMNRPQKQREAPESAYQTLEGNPRGKPDILRPLILAIIICR